MLRSENWPSSSTVDPLRQPLVDARRVPPVGEERVQPGESRADDPAVVRRVDPAHDQRFARGAGEAPPGRRPPRRGPPAMPSGQPTATRRPARARRRCRAASGSSWTAGRSCRRRAGGRGARARRGRAVHRSPASPGTGTRAPRGRPRAPGRGPRCRPQSGCRARRGPLPATGARVRSPGARGAPGCGQSLARTSRSKMSGEPGSAPLSSDRTDPSATSPAPATCRKRRRLMEHLAAPILRRAAPVRRSVRRGGCRSPPIRSEAAGCRPGCRASARARLPLDQGHAEPTRLPSRLSDALHRASGARPRRFA